MLLAELFQNKTFITILGLAAGICTSISTLPQLIKIIKTKKAEDVSAVMIIVLLSGVLLWIFYGFVKKDIPITATNIVSLLLNTVVLFFNFKYSSNK